LNRAENWQEIDKNKNVLYNNIDETGGSIMVKKIIGMGIAALMMFAVVGFAGCDIEHDSELAEYKAVAIVELQEYVAAKGESSFTRINWEIVQGYVAGGMVDIIAARNRAGVSSALTAAKGSIGGVPMWDRMGREWGFSERLKFALSVSIDKTITISGENLYVTVKLKNLTGYSLYYYSPWRVNNLEHFQILRFSGDWIRGSYPDIHAPFPSPWYFEKDSYIKMSYQLETSHQKGTSFIGASIGLWLNFEYEIDEDGRMTSSVDSEYMGSNWIEITII